MKVTGFYGIWKIIATLYHDQPRFCAKIHSERTSGHPANTNSQSKSITPILLHTVGKNKKARRHNKYKVTQKGQHFFKDTLVERLLHMINRNGKQVAGFFWTLSVLCLGKQQCHCTCVKQLFQAVTQKQIQAKRISQVVATAAQSTSIEYCCAEVPVSGSVHCMAERATVWEDKTCFSLSLLFPKPSKAALRSGRQKGGETVGKLNK